MRQFLLVFFLAQAFMGIAQNHLFQGGRSDYRIVLPQNADTQSLQAASELQYYLREVGSVEIPIVTEQSSKSIFLENRGGDVEGFHYYIKGSSLYITGQGRRGLLYGVYGFLEKELGVHWFSPDYTQIPRLNSFLLDSMDVQESASFPYRLDYYYGAINDNVWCVHNMLNSQVTAVSVNGFCKMESWWGAHTFEKLLPSDVYFRDHPEYFSYFSNKRTANSQLCLSNPEVLGIVTNSLLSIIRKNPDYYVYDVSQNDNLCYCRCKNCELIAKKYGGQSGLMIWFVNQVAERVAQEYPDKKIGTFAYRYTRSLPVGIVPAKNVCVRLCSFECCFCHPLEQCERNQDFLSDLKKWSGISSNVHVWDYCVGFMQYVAPHPYFRALQNRLQSFADHHVQGILELGQYESEWGEFSELRQWVVAKLLWKSSQDVDSLASVFIRGYYGSASSEVMDFYLLTQNMVIDDAHFTIYCDYKNRTYTKEYIQQARELVDRALQKAGDDKVLQRRVARVAAQVYYLQVLRSFVSSQMDGTYDELKRIIQSDPTYFIEHKVDLKGSLQHWGYI